jgi:uncharacterized protein YecT (DUF1311 family)
MRSLRCLFICLSLICGPASFSWGAEPDYKEGERACALIKAKPLAEPHFDGPLSESQLGACNSTSLYYGFDKQADYAAALQCAWHERAHPPKSIVDMFRGPGVLTMLYANARGVKKDIDLAERFSCEQPDSSRVELTERLHHLENLRDGAPSAPPFDLCDDITSGTSGGFCAGIREKFADAKRSAVLLKIRAGLAPEQRILFDKVRMAEEAFADLRSGEIDSSGTLRFAFYSKDRTRVLDQLLINLQRFSAGEIPAATSTDVTRLDAQMNSLYQKVMRAPDDAFVGHGTVKQAGVKSAQQAWLASRDAWMEFARVAYPRLTTEQVAAQLLRLRINQLRRLPVHLD